MAEKEQQSPQPLAPTYAYPRSLDTEGGASAHDAAELRKKKRTKCIIYVVLFIIFQTAVITAFSLTVMKVKTPKFRIDEATLADYAAGTPASPSLRATVNAEFAVKNSNFGPYKYRSTTVEFFYGGVKVGEASVPNSKANIKSTKEVDVAGVELNLSSGGQLSGDLGSGVVRITSSAKMSGKVELMFILKKNRNTDLNCAFDILMASRTIANIHCE